MKIYLAVLKNDVVIDSHVVQYLTGMDFKILKYYPRFNMLKLERKTALEHKNIKYIESIEEEKTMEL